jgi:hypothetical protein
MKMVAIHVTENNLEWASAMTGLPIERVRQQYQMDKAGGIVCVLKAPDRGIQDLKDHPLGSTAFISGDDTVINLGGENYYKACGSPVRERTSCVKRSGHKNEHEDFYGERA